MPKSKKPDELEQQIAELTLDLQRTRADFENYRKRADQEKEQARQAGRSSATLQLLPVIDTIERAIAHLPDDLQEHTWAKGIASLEKQLGALLETMNVQRINAAAGTVFDPELHEAVQFDDEAEGDHEVIAEELRAGYKLAGQVMRPAMVKVTRQ